MQPCPASLLSGAQLELSCSYKLQQVSLCVGRKDGFGSWLSKLGALDRCLDWGPRNDISPHPTTPTQHTVARIPSCEHHSSRIAARCWNLGHGCLPLPAAQHRAFINPSG